MRRSLLRRKPLVFILLFLLVLAIVAALLLAWLGTSIGALLPEAELALESDAQVRVDRERWLSFAPAELATKAGFIFYPGGRVAAEAYAPLGRALAEAGYLAVLMPLPLNLAILNPGAAADVIAAYAEIESWVIGGHSLGGLMAARFAYEQPEQVAGLVLLAAYPEGHVDLSERALPVATIYGGRDGLSTVEEIEASFALLPADARKTFIRGGNHAGFGWYGAQAGDLPAQISRAEQLAQVLATILPLMAEAGQ